MGVLFASSLARRWLAALVKQSFDTRTYSETRIRRDEERGRRGFIERPREEGGASLFLYNIPQQSPAYRVYSPNPPLIHPHSKCNQSELFRGISTPEEFERRGERDERVGEQSSGVSMCSR